jgi:hypothetical protein
MRRIAPRPVALTVKEPGSGNGLDRQYDSDHIRLCLRVNAAGADFGGLRKIYFPTAAH